MSVVAVIHTTAWTTAPTLWRRDGHPPRPFDAHQRWDAFSAGRPRARCATQTASATRAHLITLRRPHRYVEIDPGDDRDPAGRPFSLPVLPPRPLTPLEKHDFPLRPRWCP